MAYDIAEAFSAIEEELIASMIRNLKRHRAEETAEGYKWEQWQVSQLAALEEYRRRNRTKFSKDFSQIHKTVGNLINAARDDGNMQQEERILEAIRDGADLKRTDQQMTAQFFKTNDRKMNALITATQSDFKQAERAMLRQADDQYRKIIFNSMVYANSGAGTYEKAVDMATKDFLKAGIQCIEYKNGAKHTISDYADMAIKTATKRAYLTGEGEKRKEWGVSLVIINKRTDACPKCLPFQGKVMIDDVWSGGKPDGKHMLISTAMSKGLYHPRCRDSHTTYFPGISTAEDKGWTKKELEALEKDEKEREKLIYAENQAEKYDRLARHSLDEENRKKYEARAEEWGEKSEELTERRKQRLAQRRAAEDTPVKKVVFDDRVSEEQREIIEQLSSQYQTRLQKVDIGAEKAAGEVDMSGASMKLSDKHANTAIHEFAHTLANSSADKYGLTNDQEFWKEIKKIRREYMKDVEGDPSKWISAYEHSGRSLDEFMAEAFTHAKMREMGLDIPGKYGSDFTYSERVLETVDKHFGLKTGVSESGSFAHIEDWRLLAGGYSSGPVMSGLNAPGITNSDDIVDAFMDAIDFPEDTDVAGCIKKSVRHMPKEDLEMISNVGLLVKKTTGPNSFKRSYQELGKDGLLKYVIEINPYTDEPFVFAHECAHLAEMINGLYHDPEFRIVLENFGRSITKPAVAVVDDNYYYMAISDLLVEPYQGRTYILDRGIEGLEHPVELEDFVEYISDGYECFIGDPKLLESKDPLLYNYFIRRGLR